MELKKVQAPPNMDNLSETSLHGSLADIPEDAGQVSTQELDDYLQIMMKPESTRKPKDVEKLISKLVEMDIFDKSLLENLEPKPIITKLVPLMKYEKFSAGTPIFHYEQPADKLYIIFRGKAREFVPKSIDTIEKESRLHYKSDPIAIPKDGNFSLQDLATPATLNAIASLPEGPLGSLDAIYEENGEEKSTPSHGTAAKKFRKMKALFPFLKKMIAQKTATQRISDYGYKQSLRKTRRFHATLENLNEMSPERAGLNIEGDILDEFKKFPKTYFIGGVLKVEFSRHLYAGDHCGVRALKDNALRTLAVVAEEDCHCISLHKDDFSTVIEQEKSLNVDKIEFFKKLFDKFDEKIVTKFSLLWEHQTLKMGDVIFQENDSSENLYALFKGEIMISKIPTNKKSRVTLIQEMPLKIKKKNEQNESYLRVATLCPKDFFGDSDFFQGTNREFTATVSSIRAKIFCLSLETFKGAYKKYHDMFREIKTMTNLKLQWNKERFGGASSSQASTPQTLTILPDKEKTMVEVGQYLSSSHNQRHSLNVFSKKFRESYEAQNFPAHTFSPQNARTVEFKNKVDIRSHAWNEYYATPKSASFINNDNDHKIISKNSQILESQPKPGTKAEKRTKYGSLEIEADNSVQLFNRARPPREYTTKHEEMLKKQQDAFSMSSIVFFTPKRSNIKRQSNDSSKIAISTRGSSIEFLKRKVFDSKLEEGDNSKVGSQKLNSIEIDKPQTTIFTQSSLGSNPSLTSIAEKPNQKGSIISLNSLKPRKSKPLSMDKTNLILVEGTGAEKKVPVNFHVTRLLEQPKIENMGGPAGYYFAPGLRLSTKSRNKDNSKSVSTYQVLSPKGENTDENREGFKIFRIVASKGSPENLRKSTGIGEARNRSKEPNL